MKLIEKEDLRKFLQHKCRVKRRYGEKLVLPFVNELSQSSSESSSSSRFEKKFSFCKYLSSSGFLLLVVTPMSGDFDPSITLYE